LGKEKHPDKKRQRDLVTTNLSSDTLEQWLQLSLSLYLFWPPSFVQFFSFFFIYPNPHQSPTNHTLFAYFLYMRPYNGVSLYIPYLWGESIFFSLVYLSYIRFVVKEETIIKTLQKV
jgi:hypothetical protein